jgi:hypothetical protein
VLVACGIKAGQLQAAVWCFGACVCYGHMQQAAAEERGHYMGWWVFPATLCTLLLRCHRAVTAQCSAVWVCCKCTSLAAGLGWWCVPVGSKTSVLNCIDHVQCMCWAVTVQGVLLLVGGPFGAVATPLEP